MIKNFFNIESRDKLFVNEDSYDHNDNYDLIGDNSNKIK